MNKIFVDETAWLAIIDPRSPHHPALADRFRFALDNGEKLFTTNVALANAVSEIRRRFGIETAVRFQSIVDEAYLGTYLRILWIGRRTQKDAFRLMRKHPELDLHLYDFASILLMDRRSIHHILTTKEDFQKIGLHIYAG